MDIASQTKACSCGMDFHGSISVSTQLILVGHYLSGSNRVQNSCHYNYSSGATGTSCSIIGSWTYVSCSSGYYLSGCSCARNWSCGCNYGTGSTGTACSAMAFLPVHASGGREPHEAWPSALMARSYLISAIFHDWRHKGVHWGRFIGVCLGRQPAPGF
jgi:hypothetical protein